MMRKSTRTISLCSPSFAEPGSKVVPFVQVLSSAPNPLILSRTLDYMRVLVVEDEKRIADFLSRGLESGGYAVDVANNGTNAIELVHNTEYDLIISTPAFPDMDGPASCRKFAIAKPVRRC